MRKGRFTDDQMVKILRETDRSPVSTVAKEHGVSEQTIYAWQKRFGSMTANETKRLARSSKRMRDSRSSSRTAISKSR